MASIYLMKIDRQLNLNLVNATKTHMIDTMYFYHLKTFSVQPIICKIQVLICFFLLSLQLHLRLRNNLPLQKTENDTLKNFPFSIVFLCISVSETIEEIVSSIKCFKRQNLRYYL